MVLAVAGTAVATVLLLVDLTPRVESDFFFASDAPELQAAERIDELFPSRPQILLAARADDVRTEDYTAAVAALTERLVALDGVAAVRSVTSGPASPAAAFAGPFWSRLLAPENAGLTYLIVEVGDGPDGSGELVDRIEEVVREASSGRDALSGVALSGVPYVVEKIRRALERDLRIFTGAAVLVFGVVVGLLYRDPWLVAGILATCLAACATTLAALALSDLAIGVLTANIVTIVFVLTLSHLIYLTANRRRLGALQPALRVTGEASFWCMATTLAGFLSLLLASAEPLRELGKAGALGTVIALAAAYTLYPPFLRTVRAGGATGRSTATGQAADGDPFGGRRLGTAVGGIALLAAAAALGLPRIDTDPGLLAYFDDEGEIRDGLEVIDAAGGSSPLRVLFRDAAVEGEDPATRLDTDDALARLGAVQEELEDDPAVGTALSLAPLIDEATRIPMAAMMSTPRLVDMLASPAFDRAAESFVTPDRKQGLLFLRMREGGPAGAGSASRAEAIARVRSALRTHGFEVQAVAGLYDLQGELADLVASSLRIGLGGLAVLFAVVAWVVARRLRWAAAMLVCLAGTPVFLFGVFGLGGVPVDFISSPAANVALAMGIDSMIHLTTAARRARREGLGRWRAWVEARARLAAPITGAGLILATGFGLFVLSSFPPTRRFGLGVVLGIVAATALTLVVLPWLAAPGSRERPRREGDLDGSDSPS